MANESYLVEMPSGEIKGPLSLAEVKDQALSGRLPREAKVRSGNDTFTVLELVSLALGQKPRMGGRMTPEERARLAGTQASTPEAILARKTKDPH